MVLNALVDIIFATIRKCGTERVKYQHTEVAFMFSTRKLVPAKPVTLRNGDAFSTWQMSCKNNDHFLSFLVLWTVVSCFVDIEMDVCCAGGTSWRIRSNLWRQPHTGLVVEYQLRNQQVAGSELTRSTAGNLEQVAALLCAQANSASYPQRDGKWVVAYNSLTCVLRGEGWCDGLGGGMSDSCTTHLTGTVLPLVANHPALLTV